VTRFPSIGLYARGAKKFPEKLELSSELCISTS
jgi:hypothetical protein